MTKDEALQMCLEYIETDAHERKYVRHAIKAALEAKDEPWSPVSIGVDVTKEGAHVVGIYALDNDTSQIFYAKYHYAKDPQAPQRTWVGLMRGVRVEGNAVVITVKGGNDEARALCGELINEMEKNT